MFKCPDKSRRSPENNHPLIELTEGSSHTNALGKPVEISAIVRHRDIEMIEQIEQLVKWAAHKRVCVQEDRLLKR